MLDLWEAFNDVAEGFGLTIIEFREMLQCSLKEYLGFTDSRLAEVADSVFRAFDDDKASKMTFIFMMTRDNVLRTQVYYFVSTAKPPTGEEDLGRNLDAEHVPHVKKVKSIPGTYYIYTRLPKSVPP